MSHICMILSISSSDKDEKMVVIAPYSLLNNL